MKNKSGVNFPGVFFGRKISLIIVHHKNFITLLTTLFVLQRIQTLSQLLTFNSSFKPFKFIGGLAQLLCYWLYLELPFSNQPIALMLNLYCSKWRTEPRYQCQRDCPEK